MPIYDYKCTKCGHRFERIQKHSERAVKQCPACGGKVEKLITAPAVHFKGSGFYGTDYAKKSSSQNSSEQGSSEQGAKGGEDVSSSAKLLPAGTGGDESKSKPKSETTKGETTEKKSPKK